MQIDVIKKANRWKADKLAEFNITSSELDLTRFAWSCNLGWKQLMKPCQCHPSLYLPSKWCSQGIGVMSPSWGGRWEGWGVLQIPIKIKGISCFLLVARIQGNKYLHDERTKDTERASSYNKKEAHYICYPFPWPQKLNGENNTTEAKLCFCDSPSFNN